jgi:hypothetical protein
MESLNTLKRASHSLLTRRPLARTAVRMRRWPFWGAAGSSILANLAFGQSQSQLQYVYDAVGNLIQVTRSDVMPRPDLTISNLSVGAITGSVNRSYNIPVTFQVNNIGTATAAATWYDRGYLAVNASLRDTDQVLGNYNTRSTNLNAGASYTVVTAFTTSTTTGAGNYFLIVKADGGTNATGQFSQTGPNYVAESNETNNTQAVSISLPANPKADLTVTNGAIGVVSVNQNGTYSIPVTFQVNNIGNGAAAAPWYDQGYLSSDATLDSSDANLSGYHAQGSVLAAGASYIASATFVTGTTAKPGTYTLFIKADGHGPLVGGANTDAGNVVESDETNNTQALSITLPARPDLTVAIVNVGPIVKNANGSYTLPVKYTVTNRGGMPAQPNWYDLAYLSTNATLDNADLNLSGYHAQPTALAAGASYSVTTSFTTATTTAAGNYTLFIKADGRGTAVGVGTNTDNGFVGEGDETNNVASIPISLP